MIRSLISILVLTTFLCHAQVKPEYLYNTSTPFGPLDIRTKISASEYYYLQENTTFSFRESAPGVRTNTYADVTSWDSSPYGEGHMRKKSASRDDFVMNYRLLKPLNYNPNFANGYPLIVIMHGAVERGNCYYEDCYHGDWTYDPNVNVPPAPTNADHRLLNNDYHLTQSAREHLTARNLAGTKLPDDPTLSAKAFPGFVLMPQMLNVWDSLSVQDMIRVVMLHVEKYKINPDRVYIHGLSIGGYATYEAIKRAPWLFAAALPMSAVTEAANIFKYNQQDKVSHIPLWTFQGGLDDDPSPAFTQTTVNKFRSAGASMQYTVYPDLGHRVWGRAYQEANFFSWILGKSKNQIHALHGVTQIDNTKNIFPKLVLAEGFFAYEWEKDGTVIAGATTNRLTATSAGTYRARFSRKPSPTAADWNAWSKPIIITATGGQTPTPTDPPAEEPEPPPTEEPETPPSEEPENPSSEEPENPSSEEPENPPSEEPENPPTEQPGGENPDPTDEDPEPENPAGETPGGGTGQPETPPGTGGTPPPSGQPNPPGGNNGGGPDIEDPDLSGEDDEEFDGEDNVTAIESGGINISIFPNPAHSGKIFIAIDGMRGDVSVKITDMLGSSKISFDHLPPGGLEVNDLSLKDGIYNVIISDEFMRVTRRLVIQRNQ